MQGRDALVQSLEPLCSPLPTQTPVRPEGLCWPRAPPDLAPPCPQLDRNLGQPPSAELPEKTASCAVWALGNRENRLMESNSNVPDFLS